jgi:hypothetical protein
MKSAKPKKAPEQDQFWSDSVLAKLIRKGATRCFCPLPSTVTTILSRSTRSRVRISARVPRPTFSPTRPNKSRFAASRHYRLIVFCLGLGLL